MSEGQRPLELIHARNFATGLSTPAFLVDSEGTLAYYNDAAAILLGRRFEELGEADLQSWGDAFPPIDAEGNPMPIDDLPVVRALRRQRPAFGSLRFRAHDGVERGIHVSAIPILTSHGSHGALALFWGSDEEED